MPPLDGDLPGAGMLAQNEPIMLTRKIMPKQNPTHPGVLQNRLKLLKYEGVFIPEVSGPMWIFLDWVYALATKDFSSRVKPGCYASIAALADYDGLKCSKQTIRNYIDESVNRGFLIETRGGGVKTKTGWTNLLMPTELYRFFRENGNRSYWWRPKLIKARGQKAAPPASTSRSPGSKESTKDSNILGQTLTELRNNNTDRTERQTREEKIDRNQQAQNPESQNSSHSTRPSPVVTQDTSPPADHVAAIDRLPHTTRQSKEAFASAYLGTEDGVHWFNGLSVRPSWQSFVRTRYPHLQIDFRLPENPEVREQGTPEPRKGIETLSEAEPQTAAAAAAAENYAANDDLLAGLNAFLGESPATPQIPKAVVSSPQPPDLNPLPEKQRSKQPAPIVPPAPVEPVTAMDRETRALAYQALWQSGSLPQVRRNIFTTSISSTDFPDWEALRRGEKTLRNGLRSTRKRWGDLLPDENPADDFTEPRRRRRARKRQQKRANV